jgi:tetratricopeptide (TPR) repeat protein
MKLKILIFLFSIAATKAEAQTSALAIADSLYAVGNYSEAIKELRKAPLSVETELKLARVQKAKGNISAALDTYKKVLQKEPERILAAVEYAKLLSASGELEAADSLFSLLVEKDRMNPNFHYQLGLVKEKLKDSTAIKHYQTTVAFNATHQKGLEKLARYNLAKGKLIKTEILCKQGLKANPSNVTLISLLAQAFYHMKEYELAIAEFEKLVALGAANVFVHTKIGTAYAHLEKYNQAIAHFNSALEYDDENHATHYSLAKLYALTGDYKNSEGHLLTAILLKAVTLDEEFTSLGLTYKLLEKPKEALDSFSKAVEENPDNERAMFERAIAADSYYKELETRMRYYKAYLDRFEENGNRNLVLLATRRIKDIREEIHMGSSASGPN